MNAKHWLIATLAFAALGVALTAEAAPRPARVRKFKHADKNKDGRLSPREIKAEKKFERKVKAKVNTPWEARADKNKDGVVGPAEARRAGAKVYVKKKAVVNTPWEAKADSNNNGVVSAVELRHYWFKVMDHDADGVLTAAERNKFWVSRKAKVNTALEAKYDTNGDGWLSGDEARELLKDRLIIINTAGKAKVDTALEAAYDANQDGVIDKDEAAALKEALGV